MDYRWKAFFNYFGTFFYSSFLQVGIVAFGIGLACHFNGVDSVFKNKLTVAVFLVFFILWLVFWFSRKFALMVAAAVDLLLRRISTDEICVDDLAYDNDQSPTPRFTWYGRGKVLMSSTEGCIFRIVPDSNTALLIGNDSTFRGAMLCIEYLTKSHVVVHMSALPSSTMNRPRGVEKAACSAATKKMEKVFRRYFS